MNDFSDFSLFINSFIILCFSSSDCCSLIWICILHFSYACFDLTLGKEAKYQVCLCFVYRDTRWRWLFIRFSDAYGFISSRILILWFIVPMGGRIQSLFYLFLNIFFTLFNMIILEMFSDMRFHKDYNPLAWTTTSVDVFMVKHPPYIFY